MAVVSAKEYRRALDRELEARRARLQEGFAHLNEEQLNWKPSASEWSVGQCLDHLVKTDSKYYDSMLNALDAARAKGYREGATYKHGFMARFMINAMRPESKLVVPVPKMLEPSTDPTGTDIVSRLGEQIANIHELLRGSEGIDLARAVFPSPFQKLMKVRVSDAFKILEIHDHRHLLQAENLMKRSDFPAPSAALL